MFFDNIQVVQKRGAILEETHYYPFGLTMAGISSKAAGGIANKKLYNGIEFNNDLDINSYDAFFRNLDPQVGRWWQIDPKTEIMEMWSTYASNYDNPISNQDFLGDEPGPGPEDPPLKDLRRQNETNRGESTQIKKPVDCRNCSKAETTPIFTLTVTKGKQAGFKVGGVGIEVNGGSKEVLKVTSSDPGKNTANKNKTLKGGSVSLGVVSASKESSTTSSSAKNKFGSTVTKTTTETNRSLTFGIKNSPLSVGIQNTETSTTTSNPFTTYGSSTETSGPELSGSLNLSEASHTIKKGTEFSLSLYYKVDVSINFKQLAVSILQNFNTGQ